MTEHDVHRFEDDGGPVPLNYCPWCDVSEDEDHVEGCPEAEPLTDGPHNEPQD